MKKIIGAITMATAWGDLVKYGHAQAAYELDDTFRKSIASATERYSI